MSFPLWYNGYSGTVGTQEERDLWARGWGRSSPRWLWSSLWCGRSQQSELLGQRDSLGGGCPLISVTSKQVFLLSQFPILSSFYSLYHSPHLLPALSHRLSQDSHTVATKTSLLMDISETFFWDVHIMLICHFSRCLSHSLFFPDSHTHTHIKNLLLSFLSESSFDIYFVVVLDIMGIHMRCLVTRIWLFLKQHCKSQCGNNNYENTNIYVTLK